MDLEQKIDRIDGKIDVIQNTLTDHIAREEGYELPARMTKVEDTLKIKASWNGLYLISGLLLTVVGVVLAVTKG